MALVVRDGANQRFGLDRMHKVSGMVPGALLVSTGIHVLLS